MTLPFYGVMLGLSSGIVGILARRLLAQQGFVPTFTSGLILAGIAACAYAALQFAYMMILRLAKPSSDRGPVFFEALSQIGILAFLPYLTHLHVPWPHPSLAKAELIIYFAVFASIHLFFKLVSLFSASQSVRGPRWNVLGWAGGCIGCALLANVAFLQWRTALEAGREARWPEAAPALAGTTSSLARTVFEGAVYRFELAPNAGREVLLRLANPADAERPAASAYVTLQFNTPDAPAFTQQITLRDKAWAEFRIPANMTPPQGGLCRLTWSAEEEPAWIARIGVRPKAAAGQALLLSGPFYHRRSDTAPSPSLILLAVEGLGAESISGMGYRRSTTPAIDALASEAIQMSEAYTPAPEAAAACMTLLTGQHPLRHGFFENRRGPLPDRTRTLAEALSQQGYVTAAFTEGQSPDDADLIAGSGFERGFEMFDAEYPVQSAGTPQQDGKPAPAVPAGSRITLDKVAQWIDAHHTEKFFVFVRLRELRVPTRLRRYGEGFLGRGRTADPVDVFDTALADVDRQLGTFLERLRTMEGLGQPGIVITSPYGFDFSEPGRGVWRRGGPPTRQLTESTLHIPLLMALPAQTPRTSDTLVSIEDVAPTLLALSGAPADPGLGGHDLLQSTTRGEPVAVQGVPVALSMRTNQWRYTWQSGRDPFTGARTADEAAVDFTDIQRYRTAQAPLDNFQRMPETAQRFRDQLAQFLEQGLPGATTPH